MSLCGHGKGQGLASLDKEGGLTEQAWGLRAGGEEPGAEGLASKDE